MSGIAPPICLHPPLRLRLQLWSNHRLSQTGATVWNSSNGVRKTHAGLVLLPRPKCGAKNSNALASATLATAIANWRSDGSKRVHCLRTVHRFPLCCLPGP